MYLDLGLGTIVRAKHCQCEGSHLSEAGQQSEVNVVHGGLSLDILVSRRQIRQSTT